MADLLEALLQVKALAVTPERIARLLAATDPARLNEREAPEEPTAAELLAGLAEEEERFAGSVRLILTTDRPLLPAPGPSGAAPAASHTTLGAAAALDRFALRRREVVDVLASCSAAQLERVGVHPVRKLVTLADLVAIALAHDTDEVARIAGLVQADRRPGVAPRQP